MKERVRDIPLAEGDNLSALAVDVKRLGLAGQGQDDTIEARVHTGTRDTHALRVRERANALRREEIREKLERISVTTLFDRIRRIVVGDAVVRSERRSSEVMGVRNGRILVYDGLRKDRRVGKAFLFGVLGRKE